MCDEPVKQESRLSGTLFGADFPTSCQQGDQPCLTAAGLPETSCLSALTVKKTIRVSENILYFGIFQCTTQ